MQSEGKYAQREELSIESKASFTKDFIGLLTNASEFFTKLALLSGG